MQPSTWGFFNLGFLEGVISDPGWSDHPGSGIIEVSAEIIFEVFVFSLNSILKLIFCLLTTHRNVSVW